jgi:hypothetical protein
LWEVSAVARFSLQEGAEHPARLFAIRKKPLENELVSLLRLEFEIFRLLERNKLKSTGMIACRDLAIGNHAELANDPGVRRYADALNVTFPNRLQAWLNLEKLRPWVKIEFGPRSPVDHRNSFAGVFAFDSARFQVIDYPYDLSLEWITAGQASKALGVSVSTIHRLITKHEPFHGGELVRRTGGEHRRINLPLLRNLVPNG